MENIGDPVAKGEKIPDWMKKIVADLAMKDCSYGYCPTRGVLETRQFLADLTNRRGKTQITADDILFFNGLGDAIQKVYGFLRREARVIGPSPTYSTHSSGEAAHAGQKPVSYRLDPDNNWYPDLDDLRLSVKYNPAISGILIINPDNPTGAVYPERILQEMIAIAREFDLFIICRRDLPQHRLQRSVDQADLRPDRRRAGHRHEGDQQGGPLAGRPLRLDRGLQRRQGPGLQSVRAEHPQLQDGGGLLHHPAAEGHSPHPEPPRISQIPGGAHAAATSSCSNIAYDLLKEVPGIKVNRTNGAFYMSVVFQKGQLTHRQSLPIKNREVRELVEGLVNQPGVSLDKRFVYYLLASTGHLRRSALLLLHPGAGLSHHPAGARRARNSPRSSRPSAESITAYLES